MCTANGIERNQRLKVGEKLLVPEQGRQGRQHHPPPVRSPRAQRAERQRRRRHHLGQHREPARPSTHTVYAGQRLETIAKRYQVSIEALVRRQSHAPQRQAQARPSAAHPRLAARRRLVEDERRRRSARQLAPRLPKKGYVELATYTTRYRGVVFDKKGKVRQRRRRVDLQAVRRDRQPAARRPAADRAVGRRERALRRPPHAGGQRLARPLVLRRFTAQTQPSRGLQHSGRRQHGAARLRAPLPKLRRRLLSRTRRSCTWTCARRPPTGSTTPAPARRRAASRDADAPRRTKPHETSGPIEEAGGRRRRSATPSQPPAAGATAPKKPSSDITSGASQHDAIVPRSPRQRRAPCPTPRRSLTKRARERAVPAPAELAPKTDILRAFLRFRSSYAFVAPSCTPAYLRACPLPPRWVRSG